MIKISNRLSIFTLAALLSLSFMAAPSFAKEGKVRDLPEIQLTPEQQEKAKAIFAKNREAMADTKEALKEKREQLRVLSNSPNPDRAQAEALCNEIGALQAKTMLNRFDLRQELVKEGLPPQLADRKIKKDGKGPRKGDRKGKGDYKREKRD